MQGTPEGSSTTPSVALKVAALVMVIAGSVAIWSHRMLSSVDGSFDLASVQAITDELFAKEDLAPFPLPDDPQLPDQRVLMIGPGPKAPILSFYVGYYPTFDGLSENPHSPRVCYPREGWNVVQDRWSMEVPLPGGDGGTTTVRAIRIDREAAGEDVQEGARDRMLTLYWLQEVSGFSTVGESRVDTVSRRLDTGRSDVIWCRLELQDPGPDQPLADSMTTRVGQLIAKLDRCFR